MKKDTWLADLQVFSTSVVHGRCWLQALAKLPEVQEAMTRHFRSQASRAGLGLELLPGVRQLLEALKVCLQTSRHAMIAINREGSNC